MIKCNRFVHRLTLTAVLALLTALPLGCETGAQTGGLTGAGIGALAGNAIGGDTEGTLIGAAVGGGIGYIIGNEDDKKHARQMSQASQPSYHHQETGPLAGTRWQVVSLVPVDFVAPYTSKIVEFKSNGRVETTTTRSDGAVIVDEEKYRVVGRTLVINRPGYLINAEFDVSGGQLIIDAQDFRAVLERL